MRSGRSRTGGAALALVVALFFAGLLPAAPAVGESALPDSAAEPGSALGWTLRSTEALAGAPELSYQGRFTIRGGEKGTEVIQLRVHRNAAGKEIRTVVEAEDATQGLRSVMRVDSQPGDTLKITSWDVDNRRWKRVAGGLPTDRFLESDFHFEDLGFAFPTGREVASVETESRDGEELVQLRSSSYGAYWGVVSWIDPATALPRRIEFRDLKQDLWRELLFEDFRFFDGRVYPTKIRLIDRQRSVESELQIERVEFGDGSQAGEVEFESLERRIRAGLPAIPELEWRRSEPAR